MNRLELKLARDAVQALKVKYPPPHDLHKQLIWVDKRVHLASNRLERVEAEVEEIEEQIGLVDRWTKTSPEYIAAQESMKERKYHLTLDKLEHLVVQRLFELSKLNMSGTGTLFVACPYFKLKYTQATNFVRKSQRLSRNAPRQFAMLLRPTTPRQQNSRLQDQHSRG
jgi:hypothetical protein